MDQIFIIIKEDGTFDTAYSDVEADIKVLVRGEDDRKIDEVESTMDEIT